MAKAAKRSSAKRDLVKRKTVADRPRKAKRTVKSGYGDQGDQKKGASKKKGIFVI